MWLRAEYMSEDFKIEDIGKIDLNEAEAIANEDILFITEAELIEDLEEFNIIPLKDGKYADSAFTEIQKDVEIESSTAVITEDEISEDKFVATEETELPLDDIDSTDIDASHIEKQKVEIEKTQPESNRSSKRDYSYDDEEELLIFNEQKYYSDTLKTQKLSKIQFLDVESGVIISEDILPDDKIDIQAPVADEAAKPVDDDDINWIPLEKVGYQETVESDKAEITDDLEKDKSKKKSVESQAERIDNLKEVEFEILGESEELRRKEFEKRLSERSMIEPEFFLDIDRNKILSLDMDDVDLIDRDLYIDDDLDFIHSSIIQ